MTEPPINSETLAGLAQPGPDGSYPDSMYMDRDARRMVIKVDGVYYDFKRASKTDQWSYVPGEHPEAAWDAQSRPARIFQAR